MDIVRSMAIMQAAVISAGYEGGKAPVSLHQLSVDRYVLDAMRRIIAEFRQAAESDDDYEMRVLAYEYLGCTRSDAQGVIDAQDMQ